MDNDAKMRAEFEHHETHIEEEEEEENGLEEDDEDWNKQMFNSMLEIIGIIYQGRDVVEPKNQLGRISMYTPAGVLDIYNVDKVDDTRETIKHGDEFDIMDIKGPVPFANECNSLEYDLFCGAYKGHIFEFFNEWRFDDRDSAFLEKIKLKSIDGTGDIILLMGFYAHATIADVEVRVNRYDSPNVHGHVAASNSKLDAHMATSMLFLNKQHRGIPVGNDGLIPLSRSLVAVPFNSVLYLDISLVVDGQDLSTTMRFPAHKTGDTRPKNYENLSVKVKWKALYYDTVDLD